MSVTQYSLQNIHPQEINRNLVSARIKADAFASKFIFNVEADLFKSSAKEIHFIEEITFSANVSSSAYQSAITNDIPSLNIFFKKRMQQVTKIPISLNQYFQGLNVGLSYDTNSSNSDKFKINLSGELDQTSEILADLKTKDLYMNFLFSVCSISKSFFNER